MKIPKKCERKQKEKQNKLNEKIQSVWKKKKK